MQHDGDAPPSQGSELGCSRFVARARLNWIFRGAWGCIAPNIASGLNTQQHFSARLMDEALAVVASRVVSSIRRQHRQACVEFRACAWMMHMDEHCSCRCALTAHCCRQRCPPAGSMAWAGMRTALCTWPAGPLLLKPPFLAAAACCSTVCWAASAWRASMNLASSAASSACRCLFSSACSRTPGNFQRSSPKGQGGKFPRAWASCGNRLCTRFLPTTKQRVVFCVDECDMRGSQGQIPSCLLELIPWS